MPAPYSNTCLFCRYIDLDGRLILCERCANEDKHDVPRENWIERFQQGRNKWRLRNLFEAWGRQNPAREAALVREEAARLIHEIKFWYAEYNKSWHGAVSQVYPMVELIQKAFVAYCHANVPDEIVFKIIAGMEVDLWNRRALRVRSDQEELDRKKDHLRKNEYRLQIGTILERVKQIRELELRLKGQYMLHDEQMGTQVFV